MKCPSVLKSPCLPLVLLLFLDGCTKTGVIKATGVIFQDMSIDLHMTSTDLGIALGFLISIGNVASPLVVAVYKRCHHPRLFMLAGVLISSLAIILASCATTKSVVLIAFAIAGSVNTMVRLPCLLALSTLAGENFNLLYSLSTCGYSLGMVLHPFLAEELLPVYGWRGVLLLLAGFILHEIPCLMASHLTPKDTAKGDGKELEDTGSQDDSSTSKLQPEVSGPSDEDLDEDSPSKDSDEIPLLASPCSLVEEDHKGFSKTSKMHGHAPPCGCLQSIDDAAGNIWRWFRTTMVYADPVMLLICTSFASMEFVYSGWVSFVIPHALQRGISSRNLILLTFCAAVGNTFTRLAIAFSTHKLAISSKNLYLALTILNSVVLTLDACIPNLLVMLGSACFAAVSTAGRGVLGIMVIRERASEAHLPMALAALETFAGVAVYIGGWVAGLVADKFSSYDASFKIIALVDVLTFIMMLPAVIVRPPGSASTSASCKEE